jgi:endo-1,4-beta-xylanase
VICPQRISLLTEFFRLLSIDAQEAASTLNAAIVAAGRSYIGVSLTIRSDTAEQNVVKGADLGSITPENAMKWDVTETVAGNFSLDDGQKIVDFATQNKKQLRCHTLVWYSQLPNWVSGGQWTNQTLQAAMQVHITRLMTTWKGNCTHWDVVNEGESPLSENLDGC